MPERELAQRAGLGWIGKNTMLIRPDAGSFFFIGSVFTDLPLGAGRAVRAGSLRQLHPLSGRLPHRRLRGAATCWTPPAASPISPSSRRARSRRSWPSGFEGYAFGCDICNDVCPWNQRFAQPTSVPEFQPGAALAGAEPDFFERMTEEEFRARFGDTPLERPGLAGMRRNFRAAYGSAAAAVSPD